MELNQIITVKGISQKGKNRVNEHGNKWKIVDTSATCVHGNLLVQSCNTNYFRWMYDKDDCDFAIV